MNNRADKRVLFILLASVALFIIMLLIIFFTAGAPEPSALPDINSSFEIMLRDEPKSVFELIDNEDFNIFSGDTGLFSSSKYVYLRVTLKNISPEDRDVIFYNHRWNYYVEMLSLEKHSAAGMYRYGDKVPLSESPFKHTKAGFPVTVPAKSSLSFIIEYNSPSGISVIPEIIEYSEFLEIVASERLFLGLTSGMFISLLLLNLFSGILLRQRSFYPAAVFILALFFFFLRQSRLLLLIFEPLTYQDWLFPLSIGLNAMTILGVIYVIMNEYFSRLFKSLISHIFIITFILTMLSFFIAPFFMANILNIFSLVLLIPAADGFLRACRNKDFDIINITLSFLPWFFSALADIGFSLKGTRSVIAPEYLQVSGMMVSLVMLSINLQRLNNKNLKSSVVSEGMKLEESKIEIERRFVEVGELKKSVIHQLGYRIRQPLDSIQALAGLAEESEDNEEIINVCGMIYSEAEELKHILMSGLKSVEKDIQDTRKPPENDSADISVDFSEIKPWRDSSICIYDFDPVHSARTALILRSFGYEVRIIPEQYQILSLMHSGKIDILIVDPVSTGDSSFTLCTLIRNEYNIFDMPILMITNYHDDYLMKKGFGAGVNDFLTRPFDSSELSARIESLVKLKNVARNNQDLAKSEKEKNTFLYFLTHNINTPLTLLLNRIQEVSKLNNSMVDRDIVEDLQAASREMNDIVQNVLISFRLSDGRQTIRFSTLDIKSLVVSVKADLSGKASEKKQKLDLEVEAELPEIEGDYSALKGIIYNLIDNGIKFTPEGGSILVRVFMDNDLKVEVSDTGPGISSDEQQYLFERFQRLSSRPTSGESSTGLGLYVAYELARMHGGDLNYRDGKDGACFILTLPAGGEISYENE